MTDKAKIEKYKHIIGQQQYVIEEFKKAIEYHVKCFDLIYSALYKIGAPLNDNKLGFNAEQCKYLQDFIGDNIPDLRGKNNWIKDN